MKISIGEYEKFGEELHRAIFYSAISEGAKELFLLMEDCFDDHTEEYVQNEQKQRVKQRQPKRTPIQ